MKKIIFVFLLFPSLLVAHTSKKIKHFRCTVLQPSGLKITGELYKTGDSVITVIRTLAINKFDTVIISVKYIQELKIRRIGNIGRGFIYGVLAGFVVGGVIGYSQGDDPPRQVTTLSIFGGPNATRIEPGETAVEKATIGSIIGFFAGALVGPLFGSYSFPYSIQGDQKVYDKNRKEIAAYASCENHHKP